MEISTKKNQFDGSVQLSSRAHSTLFQNQEQLHLLYYIQFQSSSLISLHEGHHKDLDKKTLRSSEASGDRQSTQLSLREICCVFVCYIVPISSLCLMVISYIQVIYTVWMQVNNTDPFFFYNPSREMEIRKNKPTKTKSVENKIQPHYLLNKQIMSKPEIC